MDPFNAELSRVLKYQRERLPVSAIHPELRFTRLGAVLREHATEGSDVGELAYQALTSPHDQPLELMPLHLLRDKMQEEPDHPLAKAFNWEKLPEKVALDRAMSSGLILDELGPVKMAEHSTDLDQHTRDKLSAIYTQHPYATWQDFRDSANRIRSKVWRVGGGYRAMFGHNNEAVHDYLVESHPQDSQNADRYR